MLIFKIRFSNFWCPQSYSII